MGWKYIVTATEISYMEQGDHHGIDTMERKRVHKEICINTNAKVPQYEVSQPKN
jgi:hypothetical protein